MPKRREIMTHDAADKLVIYPAVHACLRITDFDEGMVRHCQDLAFSRGAALHRALNRGDAKKARRAISVINRMKARSEKIARDNASYRARVKR